MSKPNTPPSRLPRLLLRSVVTLVILGGVGFGSYKVWKSISPTLFGAKRTDRIPTVKTRTATISEEIVAVGRLRAVFSTELRSEINGRIAKISAVDGQRLDKGQEILRLDQQDILTQISEVDRTIEAAKLRALKARRDNERLLDLQKRGVVTLKDMEDSRITFSLAENDAAIAEARAANLRDKLDKTIVRAPHAGTLLLRDLTEGQVITGAAAQNGGTMLGEVADLSLLMIRTNINEIDVARLKVGDTARVRVDSMRTVALSGSIKRISTSALETGADRTRVFPVDVIIDEADERLRPGMSATAIFTLARVEDTLAVPLNAVFATADGARYVFLAKGETFLAHAVEVGIADTRYIQILSGLSLGDDVARTRPLVFDGEIPVMTAPAIQTKPKKPASKSPSIDPIAQLPGQPAASPKPKNSGPKPQRTP